MLHIFLLSAMSLTQTITIEATADWPRGPVTVALPFNPAEPSPGPYKLECVQEKAEVSIQITSYSYMGTFFPHRDLKAGEKLTYRLERGEAASSVKMECVNEADKRLIVRRGERKILQYNMETVQPPAGVDAVFARSGYIHPVWTPDGRVATNDFAPKHLHHHGIWFPWTNTEFEGRHVDFWNSAAKQGRIEFVKLDRTESGPVYAGFTARHRFVDLTAPGGPKPVLDEVWHVEVYAWDERTFLFDLSSEQTCAGPSPLVLKEYRYGGLGFRGSIEWEGKDGVEFLTSEGRTRADGHATRANWCLMTGKIGGKAASVGFLCNPSNFRAPQHMRIHPDEPFFNWAPVQAGDFTIKPGKSYMSHYWFIVSDSRLEKADMERFWAAYKSPLRIQVK
jgi:hypothetical protein